MAFTSVASAAADTQLLAEGSTRGGLIIVNTDANRLYVKFDSTAATSSSYSFYLDTGDVAGPFSYTGEVRGIWAADGSGAALVTSWGR